MRRAGRGLTAVMGLAALPWLATFCEAASPSDAAVGRLAAEVRDLGSIVCSARSNAGDWDIFRSRPDGTGRANLTRSTAYQEFHAQVSLDGGRLLYRRVPRGGAIDPNRYGEQGELVLANGDGSEPRAIGRTGEFPWASWSPDGTQIATLSVSGIAIVDLAKRATVRRLPRQGFFQQMTWSPDGRSLCGVANGLAEGWSVARLELRTGSVTAVNRDECCTPDWFPDSGRIVFSWRPPGQAGEGGRTWTQLWMADADGSSRQLLYAEEGRNIYGGSISPDGRYVVFGGNFRAGGDPGHGGAPLSLMRIADAPIVGGTGLSLRLIHPTARTGPVLSLPVGWEPQWTRGQGAEGGNGIGGGTGNEPGPEPAPKPIPSPAPNSRIKSRNRRGARSSVERTLRRISLVRPILRSRLRGRIPS